MLTIEIVSDYVCPYCLVGKEALKEAIKELGIEARLLTHPMELTEEPSPRVDTYSDSNRRAHYQVLVEPARQLGLDMKLPPKVIPRPYTRLAFEGHYFAEKYGMADLYDDTLYRAYFIDEKDIGNLEVLVELAQDIGLDAEAYKKALLEGSYSEPEKDACRQAKKELEVTSIPTFFIHGSRHQFSAYTKEEAIQILKKEIEKSTV